MSNPFSTPQQHEESVEQRMRRAIGSAPKAEKKRRKAEHPPARPEPQTIEENLVLGFLTAHPKDKAAEPPMKLFSICNKIRSSVTETSKQQIEAYFEKTVYYQTPETHTVKKEASSAYALIFSNWRKGLSEIFSNYRRHSTQNEEFSFFVYLEGALCFFHTPRYKNCAFSCCKTPQVYSLLVTDADESFSILSENEFKREGAAFSLSGKSVLFVLDTIINMQVSSIRALPFVLSKYFFLNGIPSKPSVTFRAENSQGKKTFRMEIRGWTISSDIPSLEENPSTVMQVVEDHATS